MENKNKIIKTGLIVLVVVLSLWLFKINYFDKPILISAVGEGKVLVKPQMVTFTLNVFNYSTLAATAVADNTRLVKDITLILKNNGVLDKDIMTSYVRIVPPTPGILGQTQYQAVNAIDVTLRNINQFDNLFNILYASGVQSITNIIFTTSDAKSLEKQAVDLAVIDAKERAKEMAQSFGKTFSRMVSVTTSEAGGAGALSGTTQGVTQASPTQIEIIRQASIVFELR